MAAKIILFLSVERPEESRLALVRPFVPANSFCSSTPMRGAWMTINQRRTVEQSGGPRPQLCSCPEFIGAVVACGLGRVCRRYAEDGDTGVLDGARIKEWLQFGQRVMLSLKVQSLTGLKAMEDRLHRLHILTHLRHRGIPTRAIAFLYVWLYLRSQTDFEAPAGHCL